MTCHDPSLAHAGGRVTPDRGFPPHICGFLAMLSPVRAIFAIRVQRWILLQMNLIPQKMIVEM